MRKLKALKGGGCWGGGKKGGDGGGQWGGCGDDLRIAAQPQALVDDEDVPFSKKPGWENRRIKTHQEQEVKKIEKEAKGQGKKNRTFVCWVLRKEKTWCNGNEEAKRGEERKTSVLYG